MLNSTTSFRILNAASNEQPVNILIDNQLFISNMVFGDVSPIDQIEENFHNVMITAANGNRDVLFNKNLPFSSDNLLTLVLISGTNGMDIVEVHSNRCNIMSNDLGCLRFANMAHENSSFDVFLSTGDMAFHDVRFKEVTNYKQARTGDYEFYIAYTFRGSNPNEVPIITANEFKTFVNVSEPLLSLPMTIVPNTSFTVYIIGNPWSASSLRAIVLQDYSFPDNTQRQTGSSGN